MGSQKVARSRPKARPRNPLVEKCAQCPPRSSKETLGAFGSADAPITLVVPHHEAACQEAGSLYLGGYNKLLWSIGSEIGFHREDCRIIPLSLCRPNGKDSISESMLTACGSRFREELAKVRSRVVVCLGGAAFRAVTGLGGDIHRVRGYWYKPSDCRPIPIRIWAEKRKLARSIKCKPCGGHGYVKGTNPLEECSGCKGSGWKQRRGDPLYGWVKETVTTTIPETVEWIFAAYEPQYVMMDQMRSVIPLKVDLDRALRALRGQQPEEVAWKRR